MIIKRDERTREWRNDRTGNETERANFMDNGGGMGWGGVGEE